MTNSCHNNAQINWCPGPWVPGDGRDLLHTWLAGICVCYFFVPGCARFVPNLHRDLYRKLQHQKLAWPLVLGFLHILHWTSWQPGAGSCAAGVYTTIVPGSSITWPGFGWAVLFFRYILHASPAPANPGYPGAGTSIDMCISGQKKCLTVSSDFFTKVNCFYKP